MSRSTSELGALGSFSSPEELVRRLDELGVEATLKKTEGDPDSPWRTLVVVEFSAGKERRSVAFVKRRYCTEHND